MIKRYWIDRLAPGGLLNTLSYMYGYSLYLYFDFAGYSAFAVGVSYLLGIHTPENFNRPFRAGNIKDFWNRWHISLSTWFRDHVYMRFMLAATKGRWFTGKYTASYLGLFLTFGLMGLWHGIEPYYLLYGLYHGTLLVGHDLFTRFEQTTAGVGERAALASSRDRGHVPPGLPGLPPFLGKDRSHVEAGQLRFAGDRGWLRPRMSLSTTGVMCRPSGIGVRNAARPDLPVRVK